MASLFIMPFQNTLLSLFSINIMKDKAYTVDYMLIHFIINLDV